MKKIVSLIIISIMSISLAACGSEQTNDKQSTDKKTESTDSQQSDNAATDTDTDTNAQPQGDDTSSVEGKTLVVYFSNTGNTRNIAELIAEGTAADVYEIEAETPYTDADLDWNDSDSRSTKEMNDESARPAISGSVDNMDQYATIYIGYPIWWGEAPRILDTFVESYDLTDKTIVPFCTSSSSGVGSSASNLESVAGSGEWLEGKRFSGKEDASAVMDWVNGLGIQ